MDMFLRDGTKIYYEIHGEKNNRTLIFLHGNMEDSSLFKNHADYFKDEYQVIIIDTRGHGKSEWGSCDREAKYRLKLLADDLKELIAGLNLIDYILVGFSDGANIAMEFAVGRPDGLSGLVLVGGNLRPWGLSLGSTGEIFKEYFQSITLPGGDLIRKKLGLMLFEPRISQKRLADIEVPTLVLAGDNDLIRKRETLKIGRLIRGSKVVLVKGADHYFIYNNWDIFNKMLEEWINSV